MKLIFSEQAWEDYLYWQTRRINDEHRLVYKIQDDSVLLAQLRLHY